MKSSVGSQVDQIAYLIRRSKRAKRVGISVHCDGRVVVTLPLRASQKVAEKFIHEKREWIASKVAYYDQFENTSLAKLTRKDYLKHKEDARKIATERAAFFSDAYGVVFNRISIRDQKTCWGSCSAKKNLNFNYKIVLISKELRDYVIVHELCHLKEMNHSPRFWNLVAQTVPNHKELRRELRGIL